MASTEPEKILATVNAIKGHGWSSVTDFQSAFYTSTDKTIKQLSGSNLRYVEGRAFAPDVLTSAWLSNGPKGESRKQLHRTITRKAASIMIDESSRACNLDELRISSQHISIPYLTTDFALKKLYGIYTSFLPCLCLLLTMLLTAPNTYERTKHVEKADKHEKAARIVVVIISMLLFGRNRATDAFQLVMGVFLSSAGAEKRIFDVCNHMGLSVGYRTVQRSLETLTKSAIDRAREFIRDVTRLWGLVYDNINFTLRKSAQRLDNTTQQLNATTSAVFSLPAHFSRRVYGEVLSLADRAARMDFRHLLQPSDLYLTTEKQDRVLKASKHTFRTILLKHTPGLSKRVKKLIRKQLKENKPCIRRLGHAKTEFFPLPALDEEEASVAATIRVVTKLFTKILGFAAEVVDTELRLVVGDWLTIRNLRLMKEERVDELSGFTRMNWIQEASMPFHFQLNGMYMLFRTHIGRSGDSNPSSLERHRTILRRSKLDPKKPEYNRAKELAFHSLIARVLDCTRVYLRMKSIDEIKGWKPSSEEFEDMIASLVNDYATTRAAHKALEAGDDVRAHSILFIRDAILQWELNEAIREADVGRMWVVYDLWIFMMRGAGCHNYGNELLEMKAQFLHEMSPKLREVVERTWLVNRWGKKGKSIPTDLYLEHNNGFIKNMFAALGSGVTMDYIIKKSSACVEVLRRLSHEMTSYFGVADFHRGRREVNIRGDIHALCLDLATHAIHEQTRERRVPLPATAKPKGRSARYPDPKAHTAVRDVLVDGHAALLEGHLFEHWMKRTGKGGTDIYPDDDRQADTATFGEGTGFEDPDGRMDVNTAIDEELEGYIDDISDETIDLE
ncbi:hypothetical protein EWM64_g7063 [Hericium alpestre]|uniref:DUF6589 domain-containing protein n=1 Tax=Hericium alpestre TaxID=135208 RepID=A0A4Y9ZTY4_9AGAM|nr:hypothetical protein EWM64_g7063 [Hericium alpestre]